MDYIIKDSELYHHGILGMKWGVRRFQNKDGSLTAAGKKRMSRKQKKALEKARATRKANIEKAKSVKEQKEEILKSRSAKQLFENAHLFDDKELQTAYNRLTLERNIKSLAPAEVSKGEALVNKAIKIGNKTSETLESGTKLYNNLARIMNAFGGNDWPIIKTGDGNKSKNDNAGEDQSKKAKKNKKPEKEKVKTEPKKANEKAKKEKSNFFEWVDNESSKSSSGRDSKPEVFGEGTSKGSQARKYEKAKRRVDEVIIDMEDDMYELVPISRQYGHFPEIVDSVNRYIDKIDRL